MVKERGRLVSDASQPASAHGCLNRRLYTVVLQYLHFGVAHIHARMMITLHVECPSPTKRASGFPGKERQAPSDKLIALAPRSRWSATGSGRAPNGLQSLKSRSGPHLSSQVSHARRAYSLARSLARICYPHFPPFKSSSSLQAPWLFNPCPSCPRAHTHTHWAVGTLRQTRLSAGLTKAPCLSDRQG